MPKNISVYWIFVIKLVPRVIRNMQKREDQAKLNHKYYWKHKEEDTPFNDVKALYKIHNNYDKVSMKQFYHIRCDP